MYENSIEKLYCFFKETRLHDISKEIEQQLIDMESKIDSKINGIYSNFNSVMKEVKKNTGLWFDKKTKCAQYNWKEVFYLDYHICNKMYSKLKQDIKEELTTLRNHLNENCKIIAHDIQIDFDGKTWEEKYKIESQELVKEINNNAMKQCLEILSDRKKQLESLLDSIPTFEEEKRSLLYIINSEYDIKVSETKENTVAHLNRIYPHFLTNQQYERDLRRWEANLERIKKECQNHQNKIYSKLRKIKALDVYEDLGGDRLVYDLHDNFTKVSLKEIPPVTTVPLSLSQEHPTEWMISEVKQRLSCSRSYWKKIHRSKIDAFKEKMELYKFKSTNSEYVEEQLSKWANHCEEIIKSEQWKSKDRIIEDLEKEIGNIGLPKNYSFPRRAYELEGLKSEEFVGIKQVHFKLYCEAREIVIRLETYNTDCFKKIDADIDEKLSLCINDMEKLHQRNIEKLKKQAEAFTSKYLDQN